MRPSSRSRTTTPPPHARDRGSIFGRNDNEGKETPAATLSEPCGAAAHDLALAHQLGVELGTIQSEINVEVDAVEGALRGIHALKILLKVLPAQIRRQSDDFLYACERGQCA